MNKKPKSFIKIKPRPKKPFPVIYVLDEDEALALFLKMMKGKATKAR